MFKKILVATDGSSYALKGAQMAAQLARRWRAQVILVTVANLPAMYRGDLKPDFINILLEDSERALLDTERIFAEKKVKCKKKLVREGKPSEVICRLAGEEGCDLIVLGTLGLHSPDCYALGSQTYQIIHEAPCSVWVIK